MSWIPAFQFARSGERASRMEVGLSDPQFPQVVPVPTPVFVCLIPDSFPAGGLNFYGIPRERAKSIKNSFIFLVSPFCHADSHDPFVRAPPSSTLSPDFAASDVHYYRQAPRRSVSSRFYRVKSAFRSKSLRNPGQVYHAILVELEAFVSDDTALTR